MSVKRGRGGGEVGTRKGERTSSSNFSPKFPTPSPLTPATQAITNDNYYRNMEFPKPQWTGPCNVRLCGAQFRSLQDRAKRERTRKLWAHSTFSNCYIRIWFSTPLQYYKYPQVASAEETKPKRQLFYCASEYLLMYRPRFLFLPVTTNIISRTSVLVFLLMIRLWCNVNSRSFFLLTFLHAFRYKRCPGYLAKKLRNICHWQQWWYSFIRCLLTR